MRDNKVIKKGDKDRDIDRSGHKIPEISTLNKIKHESFREEDSLARQNFNIHGGEYIVHNEVDDYIVSLEIKGGNSDSIHFKEFDNLLNLKLTNCEIDNIYLYWNDNISTIEIENSKINDLDLSENNQITAISIEDSEVEYLDISEYVDLSDEDKNLNYIDLTGSKINNAINLHNLDIDTIFVEDLIAARALKNKHEDTKIIYKVDYGEREYNQLRLKEKRKANLKMKRNLRALPIRETLKKPPVQQLDEELKRNYVDFVNNLDY